MIPLTPKVRELILRWEGDLEVGHPYWPGGPSGVTLPGGYDLGYQTPDRFAQEWDGSELPVESVALLRTVCGLKGPDAARALLGVRHVRVAKGGALLVFLNRSWPRYAALAEKVFQPPADWPGEAKGALVSLVFNRGELLGDGSRDSDIDREVDRREEMRIIRRACAEGNQVLAADAIVQMARLWYGGRKDDEGLVRRREEEAALVDPTVIERLPALRKAYRESSR